MTIGLQFKFKQQSICKLALLFKTSIVTVINSSAFIFCNFHAFLEDQYLWILQRSSISNLYNNRLSIRLIRNS
jgi:hypothetical protein